MNNLVEQLEECEALLFTDYDEALIGIGGAFNQRAAVYDRQKIIDQLVTEGLTVNDAEEWLEVNMIGSYVGERTPIVVELEDRRVEEYTYRCDLDRVVDGDTMDLVADLGFQIKHKIRVRLSIFNAPEPRGESRTVGKWYTEKAAGWFDDVPEDGQLFVRTSKSGKYGRWLAEIFYESNGDRLYLQDYLRRIEGTYEK